MKKLIRLFIYAVVIALSIYSSSAQYWEKATVPAAYQNSYWLDVYFLPANPQYGWVCGFDGHVLRTTDGGNTWRGTTVANANHMESIHFPTSSIGYLTGSGGKIFKSNDGGATWSQLAISQIDSGRTWGLYFTDANTGVAIGGGCGGYQYFWRTSDGGSNWSLYKDSVSNSGLTDPILYQANGVGFAASSGNIWRTDDGGVTWDVEFSTGSNIWHEELTNIGNSFLVPYSGATCTGGSNGGGMRFTTNYGVSWITASTNQRMFGAFLHDATTGWAVGDNQAVFYTEDAGRTWELKNCGIESGHMDDIWFVNRNTGWVVGSSGVYKYSSGYQEVSKSEVGFPNACVPNIEADLFRVINHNMESVRVNYSISGPDASEFAITQPSNGFTIPACDAVVVRVTFQPQSAGAKAAQINLEIDNGRTLVVDLKGSANESTVSPRDTLITINPAPVGQKSTADLLWYVENENEFIVNAVVIEGNTNFRFEETLPKRLNISGENKTKFSIVPRDTGWTYARFRIGLDPCEKDTFITVRAYGVSSIVSAQAPGEFKLECIDELIDTVDVANNGNDDLVIDKAEITNAAIGFSIIGWTSSNSLPITIPPGGSDGVIIRFSSSQPGNYNTLLRLHNNDNTTARGEVNPLDLQLSANYNQTFLSIRDSVIDLGRVCIGESKDSITVILNPGGVTAHIPNPYWDSEGFELIPENSYPIAVDGDEELELTVRFSPKERKTYIDTVYLDSSPCDEILRLIVKGEGIEADFVVKPFGINRVVKTGETELISFNVENTGNLDLSIDNFYLNPAVADIQFIIISVLPDILVVGENRNYEIEIISDIDNHIVSQICVETSSECPLIKCIDLDIVAMTTKLYADRTIIDFGYNTCDIVDHFDTVRVYNEGATTERVENAYLSPDVSAFTIVQPTSFPQSINPDEQLEIVIKYTATMEEAAQTVLFIETSDESSTELTVDINAEYRNVNTTPLNPAINFGENESCDNIKSEIITFSNEGTIQDTLLVISSPGLGYSIEPLTEIFVPENSTTDVTISFDPSQFPGTGEYPRFFELRSTLCSREFIIDVDSKIIKPIIDYSPTLMNFGEIWVGDKYFDTVKISNNSGYSKTITDISIVPDNASFQIDILTPFDLLSGESISFPISSIGELEGTFERDLRIIHKSVCTDTNYVHIISNVPKEEYNVELKMGDYVQEPGDKFTVHLELLGEVYKFVPESFSVDILFNPKLFEPISISVLSEGDYIDLPDFDYSDGKLSFVIEQEYAENLFTQAAVIVMIKGIALVSSPSKTPLEFGTISFTPEKEINLKTDDGTLEVVGFCWIRGVQEIEALNTINIQSIDQAVMHNTARYSYEASGKLELESEIVDFSGNRFAQSILEINDKTGTIELNIKELKSGIYIVRFRTEYGVIFQNKLIVIQ